MISVKRAMLPLALCSTFVGDVAAQQVADSAFDTSVRRPAHTERRPVVVIDEAHRNFHTMTGRYAPFAALLRNDGFRVKAGTSPFTAPTLRGVDVLVISNAEGPDEGEQSTKPAFTDVEGSVLREWVRGGGALLLIADHAPYGAAAENVARQFGVEFGKGFAFDSANSLPDGAGTMLVFSRENGLLGAHPILSGRDSTERINRVVSFTGQSMSVPEGAVALLAFSKDARESPDREGVMAKRGTSVAGRAQGIAMRVGAGRVVMLGEAAMMSAQVSRWRDGDKERVFLMGMNMPGSDDKQFAINVMRWLSGALR
jgi:hypothetical protein